MVAEVALGTTEGTTEGAVVVGGAVVGGADVVTGVAAIANPGSVVKDPIALPALTVNPVAGT